jgi:hypothetical protein
MACRIANLTRDISSQARSAAVEERCDQSEQSAGPPGQAEKAQAALSGVKALLAASPPERFS